MAVAGQDRIWQVGEVAVVRAEFRDETESLTDPSTITVKTKAPDGTVTSYTYAGAQVTRASEGIYTKEITLSSSGKWVLGTVATGAVATAANETIQVAPDPFS